MKKFLLVAVLLSLVSMVGCELPKYSSRRRSQVSVTEWLACNASPAQLEAARRAVPFDPDFYQALQYSVSCYISEVANLQKVQVYQDGVAVWENALSSYSENIQKELEQFTTADRQAAYAEVVRAAADPNATPQTKKALQDLNTYFTWGETLGAQAAAAAKERNRKFLAAVLKYTLDGRRIAAKYKGDKRNKYRYIILIGEISNNLRYLRLAAEAAAIEARIMEAARAASAHLQIVEVK